MYTAESQRHYINDMSSKWPKFIRFKCNRFVDEDTKLAALGVLPSVVALIAYHGTVWLFFVFLYKCILSILLH